VQHGYLIGVQRPEHLALDVRSDLLGLGEQRASLLRELERDGPAGAPRRAVDDLLVVRAVVGIGESFPAGTGWPWPCATSHRCDWIITDDPTLGGVCVTVGGGMRWHHLDPSNPQPPCGDTLRPADITAWLLAPADPPSVPLPLMRDPARHRLRHPHWRCVMLLSSTHDFYLGRGPDAEWLGSVHLGDRACSGLSRLNGATTADE
jgi:hypothetical protein